MQICDCEMEHFICFYELPGQSLNILSSWKRDGRSWMGSRRSESDYILNRRSQIRLVAVLIDFNSFFNGENTSDHLPLTLPRFSAILHRFRTGI
ncbi:unnamed protein product [Litomosoides sigmodontis]|uniref:Uncharacterized protein n=1 Tax=Litomosoides sigmodontis TaxID=42156 RepID=A0A3P6U3Q1_LITSI|nr:unnamed protein product [Litomosoides sigmodontis]